MKVVRKEEAVEFKNGDTCVAVEYPLGDPDLNGAIVRLSGRYPEKGCVANRVCKEIVYVLQGQGHCVVNGTAYELYQGDMALLLPNEEYYFEGTMEMFVPCSPAWYSEQHQMVEA